jgi:hypothetical protein
MSVKVQKNGLFLLEISAIKLEKVSESARILEKGLLESADTKHISKWRKGRQCR